MMMPMENERYNGYEPEGDLLDTGVLGTTYKVRTPNNVCTNQRVHKALLPIISAIQGKYPSLMKVVKMVYPTLNPSVIESLEILKKLDHPNLVKFNHFFTDENELCLVSEYPAATLLKDRVKIFSLDQCRLFFLQIFVAMNYLHVRNIYHKTLTTANIFIDKENHLEISDYGLATIFEENPFVLNPDREPIYTAPEIFFGEKNSHEPDVWSIATVFYEILTGTQAFIDNNPHNITLRITECAYNKGLLENEGTLGQLVKKMLDVKRSTRISLDDARDLFQSHGTISAPTLKESVSTDVFIYRVIISQNRPYKIVKINVQQKTCISRQIIKPDESYNAGQVCINDRVFQIGGKPHYNRTWEIFDTGVIEERANMIHGRQYPGCLVVYNPRPQLYVLGGTDEDGEILAECELYDLNRDKFCKITPLPVPKSSVCICQFNNEWLYTIGGFNKNGALARIDRINVITTNIKEMEGSWEEVILTENEGWSHRMNSGAVQFGTKILIYGGYAKGSMMTDVFLFNTENGEMIREGSLNIPDSFLYSVNPIRFQSKMGVLGFNADMHIFSFEDYTWQTTPRHDYGYQY